MTDKNYCDITFILDRSGSMYDCVNDTIGGYNAFVKKQKDTPGKCLLTTVQFDDVCEFINEAININEVEELTGEVYFPRNTTSLNDAIGKSILKAGNRFSYMKEEDRPGKVLFVIITDGWENSSKEFTSDQIKEMVKEQEDKYDWDFVFMGANIDAWGVGGVFKMKKGSYTSFKKVDMLKHMANFSDNTSTYRGQSLKDGEVLTAGLDDVK